jgi:hypothetical protein
MLSLTSRIMGRSWLQEPKHLVQETWVIVLVLSLTVKQNKSRFLCTHFLTFRNRNTCPNLFDNNFVRLNIRLVQKTQIKSSDKMWQEECHCDEFNFVVRYWVLWQHNKIYSAAAQKMHICICFKITGEMDWRHGSSSRAPALQTQKAWVQNAVLPIIIMIIGD